MIVNDNQQSLTKLERYFCDTSIHAMSMISHEICFFDTSDTSDTCDASIIQVIQLIHVIQVRLAHL